MHNYLKYLKIFLHPLPSHQIQIWVIFLTKVLSKETTVSSRPSIFFICEIKPRDFSTESHVCVFVYLLNYWCPGGSFSFVVSLYKLVNTSRVRSVQVLCHLSSYVRDEKSYPLVLVFTSQVSAFIWQEKEDRESLPGDGYLTLFLSYWLDLTCKTPLTCRRGKKTWSGCVPWRKQSLVNTMYCLSHTH